MVYEGVELGFGYGGGIYNAGGPVYIDTVTVANTINNIDDYSGLNGGSANLDGSYTVQNC
jgi:hypothetical protein